MSKYQSKRGLPLYERKDHWFFMKHLYFHIQKGSRGGEVDGGEREETGR